MSEKLKKILQGGEEPYYAQAWDNLSSKLDQTLPTAPVKTNLFKVLASVAVLSTAIILVYITFKPDTKAEDKKKDLPVSIEHQQEKQAQQPEPKKSTPAELRQKTTQISERKEVKEISKHDQQKIENFKSPVPTNSFKNSVQISHIQADEIPLQETKINMVKEVEFPKLKNSYCPGELVLIKNTNNGNLLLTNDLDEKITIAPNSQKDVKISTPGNYYFKYYGRSEKVYQQDAFHVPAVKNLSIVSSEELFYENGIPYFEVNSKDFTDHSQWKTSKGMLSEQGSSVKVRCMDKGDYVITLSQTDSQSCPVSESIKVQVKDQYNLLAVNAFIPEDHNPKNRSFMPEALKYRQTGFKLIILDSKDNHLVFQSESVDTPWDGIDQANGKMVESKQLFIWKVELKNPESGERAEYSGTVVKL